MGNAPPLSLLRLVRGIGAGTAAYRKRNVFALRQMRAPAPTCSASARRHNRLPAIAVACRAPSSPAMRIRYVRLQTSAYFNPLFVVLNHQQDQQPFVLRFRTNAPLAEKIVGEIFNRLPVQRLESVTIANCAPNCC